jgi:glutathionyl-hydroquinone reductase
MCLAGVLERMLAVPGLKETMLITHFKVGYHSIKAPSPSGIIPAVPAYIYDLVA